MSAPPTVPFTYRDYVLLPEDGRYEIIEGELYMTPAPTPYHQIVLQNLNVRLYAFVQERGLGRVLPAPCDVLLSETNVVQPDIFFIAKDRASIIAAKYVSAGPDLVVEVLSPSTAERDRTLKRNLYARFGVKELWIVSPEAQTIEVLILKEGSFQRHALYGMGDALRSPLLPGLEIPIAEAF